MNKIIITIIVFLSLISFCSGEILFNSKFIENENQELVYYTNVFSFFKELTEQEMEIGLVYDNRFDFQEQGISGFGKYFSIENIFEFKEDAENFENIIYIGLLDSYFLDEEILDYVDKTSEGFIFINEDEKRELYIASKNKESVFGFLLKLQEFFIYEDELLDYFIYYNEGEFNNFKYFECNSEKKTNKKINLFEKEILKTEFEDFEDMCADENILAEFYCYEGLVLLNLYDCSNGCVDGACACKRGYENLFRCDSRGRYLQQAYTYSSRGNCRISWRNKERCRYGCDSETSECKPKATKENCPTGYIEEFKCSRNSLYQNYQYISRGVCKTSWKRKERCSYGCDEEIWECKPKATEENCPTGATGNYKCAKWGRRGYLKEESQYIRGGVCRTREATVKRFSKYADCEVVLEEYENCEEGYFEEFRCTNQGLEQKYQYAEKGECKIKWVKIDDSPYIVKEYCENNYLNDPEQIERFKKTPIITGSLITGAVVSEVGEDVSEPNLMSSVHDFFGNLFTKE